MGRKCDTYKDRLVMGLSVEIAKMNLVAAAAAEQQGSRAAGDLEIQSSRGQRVLSFVFLIHHIYQVLS